MRKNPGRWCLLLLLFFSGHMAFGQEDVSQPLVTNIFSETDIRQALRDISAQTRINIIPDNTVVGMISAELHEVPLEKCLEMVLIPGGYVFKKINDYYLVGSPNPKSASFRNLSSTAYVNLKYLKLQEVSQILPDMFSKYIETDKTNNILIITAPDKIITQIKDCVKEIDIPPPQVMIEAIVTEISSNSMKSIGVDWKWEGSHDSSGGEGDAGKVEFNNLIGKLNYSSNIGLTKNMLMTLKMLIEKGEAKIRANPRVIALNNQQASIYIGKEKYYSISGNDPSSYARLEMISSGIVLKILPRVNGEEVTVDIEPEVSDVYGGDTTLDKLPLINKRKVKTTVRIKDGETIVIGGLLQQHERKGENRIPILGRIPGLRFLFRNMNLVTTENEIVVLITPHILKENAVAMKDTGETR